MKMKTLTVTEVNNYISKIINTNPLLHNISVSGEVFNLKNTSYGYSFFSLKDRDSKINCIIFEDKKKDKKINILDGLQIRINGQIKVYEKTGTYSIIVKDYFETGSGELYADFIKIKERLKEKGYFELKHKKEIKKFPNTIGIITSAKGAAINDIIKTISRRYPIVKLKIFDAKVQGPSSIQDIIKGIEYFNTMGKIDTLIITRGGGSFDDLSIFNDESIAEAIFRSKIPVISAIGHETDYFISDLVSDLRASTPTAAAELSTPNIEEIFIELEKMKNYIDRLILDSLKSRKNVLNTSRLVLEKNSPQKRLETQKNQLSNLFSSINFLQQDILKKYKYDIESVGLKLNMLSPLNILNKGYAVIEKSSERVYSLNQTKIGDKVDIKIRDGVISAEIINLKKT